MKKNTVLAILSACCLLTASSGTAQYVDLLSLSDPAAFGPLVPSTFTGTGSQGPTGWVVNGSIAPGDLIFGDIASSQDWSSVFTPGVSSFGLLVNFAAPNNNIPFALEFLDSSFETIDVWSAVTGTTAFSGYIDFGLAPTTPGTGVYSDVKGVILTWANASTDTVNTTVSAVAVVPEPSTYALLSLAGLALGVYAIRHRRLS